MDPGLARALRLLIAVVILAAVVRTYLPVTGRNFGFVFDDQQYLVENIHVHSGLTAQGVRWAFTTTYASNWHPLTWLSHMLDVTLYGSKPMGHHLTNVLLHALAAVLLLAALFRLTGEFYKSAFVAAMFGLHPLRVESVAWAAERKDVLCGVFWMLTMIAYAGYARKPGKIRYAGVVLAFACALMSKPAAVTLPVVLLLLDYWPLGRGRVLPAARHLPLFAMSTASAAVTLYAQQSTGAVAGAASLPLGMRAANAAVAYAAYIGKMFWPAGLAVYYPHPLGGIPAWQAAGSALLLAAVTYAAVRLRKCAPYLAVGWLWYLVTLLPMAGLVQAGKQAMADRYTYIPMIGILLIAAWGVPDLAERIRLRISPKSKAGSAQAAALAALAIAVTALAAARTGQQIGVWRNEVTLFSHALKVTRNNWMAHHGLARALDQWGKTEDAVRHYRISIRIDPTNADVRNGLATALLKLGRTAQALREFETAVRLDPGNAAARLNYGAALDHAGRLKAAERQFRQAVRLAPDSPVARANLAGVLARRGKFPEAVRQYRAACEMTGYSDLQTVASLADACYRSGDRREALRIGRLALRLAEQMRSDGAAGFIRGRLRVYEGQ